jgi:Uma2 family endonuclease
MATVSGKLITAEEFARMPDPPDGSLQELVRGKIITMPPPGGLHGVCCSKVDRRLGTFVDEHGLGTVTSNDTGFITERDPDTVRGPDVSFWNRDRLTEIPKEYIQVAPDLAVEVVSPGDHFAKIQKKVLHYLGHGVRLVWVVDPDDRSVTIYRPGQQAAILEEKDTISAEDVVPGFACPVAAFFP